MAKVDRKQLVKAAKELNKFFEDGLDLDAKDKQLQEDVLEAAAELTPDDELSKETQATLKAIGFSFEEEEENEDVEDGEEEEEEPEQEDLPFDEDEEVEEEEEEEEEEPVAKKSTKKESKKEVKEVKKETKKEEKKAVKTEKPVAKKEEKAVKSVSKPVASVPTGKKVKSAERIREIICENFDITPAAIMKQMEKEGFAVAIGTVMVQTTNTKSVIKCLQGMKKIRNVQPK